MRFMRKMRGGKTIQASLAFLAAAAVLFFTAMAARAGLGHDAALEYFMVKEILIEGLDRISAEEAASALSIKPGTGIFSVDLKNAGLGLERRPLVASVEVRRKLPSTLYVKVTERWPSFLLEAGAGSWLLDDSSVVVSLAKDQADGNGLIFIRAEGLDGAKIRPGMKITAESVPEMAETAKRLKDYRLFGKHALAGLEALGAERVTLHFSGTSAVVIALRTGGSGQLERLWAMDLLLRGAEEGISQIDLSFADKAVVRRAPAEEQNQG